MDINMTKYFFTFKYTEAICIAIEENKTMQVSTEKRHKVGKGYIKLSENTYFYFPW